MTDQPKPGTSEWLKARIAEHKAAQEQAIATANANSGAWQAYERLLQETAANPPVSEANDRRGS
jgi:hypothetical protein